MYIGGTAGIYSKRANRGHNPKYEQDAYVSFCGQKRKQPEGGHHSRVIGLEKETFDGFSGESSHDGKEENAQPHSIHELEDEENEEEDDDDIEDDDSYICSEKRRSRPMQPEGYGGCARTNQKGNWSKEEVRNISIQNPFLYL